MLGQLSRVLGIPSPSESTTMVVVVVERLVVVFMVVVVLEVVFEIVLAVLAVRKALGKTILVLVLRGCFLT